MNTRPARVINLSLGGGSACTAAYRTAIDEVIAQGSLVVASAGNEGGAVSSPANCSGVLGVAGVRHIGTKTGLSNMGPEIGLSAPSGNCVNTDPSLGCLFPIVVAKNAGATTPTTSGYTGATEQSVGTSFSAPQVAGAAALMTSLNAKLSPGQLIALLQESATPFPVNAAVPQCAVSDTTASGECAECNCTTQTCGAGLLNAAGAVTAAQRPFAIIHSSGSAAIGAAIALDGSDSFASDNRSITAIQWSVTDLVGAAPVIAASTEGVTSLQIPGASSFTLRLLVTDDQGSEDEAKTSFATPAATPTPTSTPTPTPVPSTPVTPASKSGGGGGGSLGWELLALFALTSKRIRRRSALD